MAGKTAKTRVRQASRGARERSFSVAGGPLPASGHSGAQTVDTAMQEAERFRDLPIVGAMPRKLQQVVAFGLVAVTLILVMLAMGGVLRADAMKSEVSSRAMAVSVHAMEIQALLPMVAQGQPPPPEISKPVRSISQILSSISSVGFQDAAVQWNALEPRLMSPVNGQPPSMDPFIRALSSDSSSHMARPVSLWYLAFSIILLCLAFLLLILVTDHQKKWLLIQSAVEHEQVQNSIVELTDHLRQVSAGDLTVRAPMSDNVVGALAEIVNSAVSRLQDLVSQIKANADRTKSLQVEATESTTELVLRSRQDLSSQAETGQEVLGLSDALRRSSGLMQQVDALIQSEMEAVGSNARSMREAQPRVRQIRGQSEEVGRRVSRLGKYAEEVVSVVASANQVAERARVISTMMRVHAAKAGDSGKPFRAIAEHVDDWSGRAQESGKRISALVDAMVADILSAREAADASFQGADEVSRLVDLAGSDSEHALRQSEQLLQLLKDLSSMVSDQDRVAQLLDVRVREQMARIEDSRQKSEQASSHVLGLMDMGEALKASTDRFRT